MDKPNIILTGFMATGKTTVGKLLADRLGYEFIDTEDVIRARSGKKTVAEIFREKGASAIREMEAAMVKKLGERQGLVISIGGNSLLKAENITALVENGKAFFLTAAPEEIMARVAQDKAVQRPLLDVSDPFERVIESMLKSEEEYRCFPQMATSGKTPEEVADILAGIIQADPYLRLPIRAPSAQYDYMVGAGLLRFVTQLAGIRGPAAIITDDNVGAAFAGTCGSVATIVTVPAGAENKTLSTVKRIYDQLLKANFDRSGTIIALGGGVISELAGFVAATFMRGVDCVQCPTSLLAMVDTSIGGKAALDLPQGQNLIGAFKQPKAVIADVATLEKLPLREFASGMAETIKHGMISDPDLLAMVQENNWTRNNGAPPPTLSDLQALVSRAIRVKIQVVQDDPYDQGRRTVLNLGHTFAHAIEKTSAHSIRHGEAVAMGLTAAVNLSARLGYCPATLQDQVEMVLTNVCLPVNIPGDVAPERLLNGMWRDKKHVGGRQRFVLIRDLGDVFVSDDVPEEAVLETLQEMCERPCF